MKTNTTPANMMFLASLNMLRIACLDNHVIISDIRAHFDGFVVTFEDIPGDAVLHKYSHNSELYYWETIGLPWDNNDISSHDPYTLARMLGALRHGEDWTRFDGD